MIDEASKLKSLKIMRKGIWLLSRAWDADYVKVGIPNPRAMADYQALSHSEPGHRSGRRVHTPTCIPTCTKSGRVCALHLRKRQACHSHRTMLSPPSPCWSAKLERLRNFVLRARFFSSLLWFFLKWELHLCLWISRLPRKLQMCLTSEKPLSNSDVS